VQDAEVGVRKLNKKNRQLAGTVTQACKPSYLGGGDQENNILRSTSVKKVFETLSQPIKSSSWWYTPVIAATWEE
jgi:hypothetical protein